MPFFIAAAALVVIGAGTLVYEHFVKSFGSRVVARAQSDLGVSNTGDPGRVLQIDRKSVV